MEFEVLLTGIGGQGIQLAAKSLALGAINEGRQTLLASETTGAMRGGHSVATVVVGDGPIQALPVVSSVRSAIAFHPLGWAGVAQRLLPGSLVVVNSTLVAPETIGGEHEVVAFDATSVASRVANEGATGFVLLGAFCAASGLVSVNALIAAMTDMLPSYRRDRAHANAAAIVAGSESVPASTSHRITWPERVGASR